MASYVDRDSLSEKKHLDSSTPKFSPTSNESHQSSKSTLIRIWKKMTPPLAVLAALALGFRVASGSPEAETQTSHGKPNFIFIMTDDQDHRLGSLDYQKTVQEQLMKKGTTFRKHYCTVSLCCPSRVSLLTGKAAHNTNVTDVRAPWGGYSKFVSQGLNDAYLPIWLQGAGYNTYYTGKLMNQHSTDSYKAPFAKGWTRSDFLLDPGTYRYLDGIMSLDYKEPRSIRGEYSTDVIAKRSVEFLNDAIAAGKPFFLGVTPVGPHTNAGKAIFEPPIPADRHKNLFPGVKVPRSVSFNPSTAGHVSYLKNLPPLTEAQVKYGDDFYRLRLQTLQSVDDLVGGLITALEKNPKVLANTYIIYTSDNGYHIGQHRMPPGKTCNIEEDINVPFIVRGPGVAAGKEVSFPTSHTDIVPTLFKLAGISLHDDFDGIPIPVKEHDQKSLSHKSEHVNVEFWGTGNIEGLVYDSVKPMVGNNTYKTVRVISDKYDFMYAVWCTNEHQLYNLKDDPNQMTNLYGTRGTTAGYEITSLAARLDGLLLTLKGCKGKVCREPWKALFPDGKVSNLGDALDKKYDTFFLKRQKKVSFSKCAMGYITAFEGPLEPLAFSNDD